MTRSDRRTFLRTAVAGGACLGLEGLVARGLLALNKPGAPGVDLLAGGYGPLAARPSENTGEIFLALPQGFHYTVFGRTGDLMSDGRPTPPNHDGMAAFPLNGKIRLVRNHESTARGPQNARCIGDPNRSYDRLSPGGATTLVINPATRLPETHFVSLSGTSTNCAGGPTPWGSWISCEEIVVGPRVGSERTHGYCFEVPVAQDHEADPVPLKAMGRFVHEAIAVDPSSGIVYETEDALTGGFYRFIPATKGRLGEGGRLEMLAIRERAAYDTRTGQAMGEPLPVTWVPIPDSDPANAEQDRGAVYRQGLAGGGATFARLEGCWYGGGSVFLNATSGGDRQLGQVWRYRPRGEDRGELTLLFESPSANVLESPDTLCVSPRGGLLLCEDGPGDNYLRGLGTDGRIFDFARNLEVVKAEFAGATFSPDGSTLFVNIQTPGLTFAIWGPWDQGIL